jgi:hypothetical protein
MMKSVRSFCRHPQHMSLVPRRASRVDESHMPVAAVALKHKFNVRKAERARCVSLGIHPLLLSALAKQFNLVVILFVECR